MKTVTQAEFDQIVCNRCGACCEGFYQPPPLELAVEMANLQQWIRWYDYWLAGGTAQREESDTNEEVRRRRQDALRVFDWWSAIEPTGGPMKEGRYQYRCTYFKRTSDGLGLCTVHERRSSVCRDFPYGQSVLEHVECSWNVEIQDEEAISG